MVTANITNVRLLTKEDSPEVMRLVLEFQKEILDTYNIIIDQKLSFQQLEEECINTSFILEDSSGVIGILIGKMLHMPGITETVYQEVIWFVKKEARRDGRMLIGMLEEWCRSNNIKFILTSCILNGKEKAFDVFYRRRGFVPYEINYIKNLNGGARNVETRMESR